MINEHAAELLPKWTIPSFKLTAGKYPLGLEAVSLNVLGNTLAPGFPALSRHPRYWSIYTYLIKRFQETRNPTNHTTNAALGRYIKSREIVFACAALLHHQQPLRNVQGSDTFGPWLNDHTHPSSLLPASLAGELGEYLKQPLGGYGQIYRGAMIDLELVFPADYNNDTVNFDIVWGEVGAAVADTFASAIAETTYVREYIDNDNAEIPLAVVRELGELSCFCQLRHHKPERTLLTDVLLGKAQASAKTHVQDAKEIVQKRTQRAETVRMFLDLADQTQGSPLNEALFRELLYFGHTNSAVVWHPRPQVQKIWRQWWLIQLREVFVNALNTIFIHFVKWGSNMGGVYHPLDLDSYVTSVATLHLPSLPGLPDAMLAEISLGQIASIFDTCIAQGGWPLSDMSLQQSANKVLSERVLTPSGPLTSFLTLILAQRRIAWIQHHDNLSQEEKELLEEGKRERLSTFYISQWLAKRIERDETAPQTFTALIQEMIVAQHMYVALGKLSYNAETFRFYEEEDGVSFAPYKDVDISSISLHFDAISEALYGLDLLQESLIKKSHALTTYGWEIINDSTI